MTKKILIYSGILAIFAVVPSTAQSQESSDKHCREFTQIITINGKDVQGFGTACKSSKNDDWQIISQAKPREVKPDKIIVKEYSSPKVVILKQKKYPRYGYNNHGYSRHNDFVDKHHYKRSAYHGKRHSGFHTGFHSGFHGPKSFGFKSGYHKKSHYKKKHYAKKY